MFSDDSVFENPRHLFDLRIPRDNAVHGMKFIWPVILDLISYVFESFSFCIKIQEPATIWHWTAFRAKAMPTAYSARSPWPMTLRGLLAVCAVKRFAVVAGVRPLLLAYVRNSTIRLDLILSVYFFPDVNIQENKQLDLPLPVYELDERMFFVSSGMHYTPLSSFSSYDRVWTVGGRKDL